MKTALILCPQWCADFPVYSLALLSAQLKSLGHEPAVFDLNRETHALRRRDPAVDLGFELSVLNRWDDPRFLETRVLPAYGAHIEALADRILSWGARVAGFSVYSSNAAMSLYVARRLKERDPGVTVVFGGPSCLSFQNCLTFLAERPVDAVVFGEADLSFPRLVDDLARGGRLRACAGVLLQADPSTWVEAQEPVLDLDSLPFADYDGHDLSQYGNAKTIHTCRGCVRRCVFCSDWREMGYRQMSGKRIFDEMAHQIGRTPHVRKHLFGDSIINSSKKSMDDFCGRMIDASLEAQWGGFAIVRPDLEAADLAKMRRAGCRWLTFGVESGSDLVLSQIGKNVPADLNARVLRDAAGAGIFTIATWLVGFPAESDEAFEQSLDFLRRNGKSIRRLIPSLFSVQSMPGETGHTVFWSGRDGRNTFPVRVERLRRLVKEAGALGIETKFDGDVDQATIDARCESLLAGHIAWEAGGAARA